ncbi:Na+/H+ antiporter NhaC family protein [uncultured Haemophilus sp.]|uniref:Na+/H+ antiporter NhaC family protein n=1 Tax=uncultured Haemophilus sp. TaxID=237779 RepID=UPI0025FD6054|nr:Na+/H+ antiporter NhaC family protein [uncultured Haemophilus sp.]
MLKKLSVILTALCLFACSQNVELSKPAPQKMKVQTVDKKSQKGSATVYLCKGNKEVSVVHTKQKQKSKKTLSQVTVTFNDVTEKLTRVISERGRNYANIRWYWQERDDFSQLQTSVGEVSLAMLIPVSGMILGLLTAVFVTYRKPREYMVTTAEPTTAEIEQHIANIKPIQITASAVAIVATFATQLFTSSTIIGGLVGLIIFGVFGIFKLKESNDIFQQGLRLMAMIGFVMIAASGFANVINTTSGVKELVDALSTGAIQSKGVAAFLMLLVGLLITMGIGSSFSTVPIITSIYVPLCLSFGFSPLSTVAIVGVAAALGDAGSPASDSTLGPTSGLNIDGKHDHIWDSVVPTFIHYNIPLLAFGWIAAMTL